MASLGKIDEFVSEAAFRQLDLIVEKLSGSNKAILQNISSLGELNNKIGGAKNTKDLSDTVQKQSKAIESVGNAVAKARIEEIKLQQAREKAFDDYERKLIKQQALADKATALETARVEKAITEQRRLQEIADKKAAKIGPTIIGGTGDSRELTKQEADAIDRKNQALVQERVLLAQTQQAQLEKTQAVQKSGATTDIAAGSNRGLAETETGVDKALRTTIGTLRQNIEQQVNYESELKRVQTQIKNTDDESKKSRDTKAQLIQREIELKSAIQQNSTVIKQQVRDQQTTVGSIDGLKSRLQLLKTAYANLTEEERKNKDIGGVLLTSIQQLDAETKKLANSQQVYESKLKSLISTYLPFGKQLVSSINQLEMNNKLLSDSSLGLGKLGAGFASFTIAGFALAISSASFYLSQFADTQTKVDKFLGDLKQGFGFVGEVVTGSTKVNGFFDFFDRLGKAEQAGRNIVTLRKEFGNFNDVLTVNNDRQKAIAEELRAQARNKLLGPERRIELLQQAQVVEAKVIENEKINSKRQIALAIEVGNSYKTLSKTQITALQNGDIALANSLKKLGSKGGLTTEGYELYKEALKNQTQVLRDETLRQTRLQNDRDMIQLRTDKKNFSVSQELNKEKLREQQVNARAIIDSDKTSFQERLAANQIYTNASIKLIRIYKQEELNNIDPLLAQSGKKDKRSAIELKVSNDIKQIRLNSAKEVAKIQDDINKAYDDAYKLRIKSLTDSEKAQVLAIQNASNEKLQVIDSEINDQKQALAKQLQDGLITSNDYNTKLFGIEQSAAARRVEVQIAAIKQVIDAQAVALATGIGSAEDLQKSTEALTKLQNDAEQLKLKVVLDSVKQREQAIRDLHKLEADLAYQSLDLIVAITKANTDKQNEQLDEQASAIDKQAERDKKNVDNSLLTAEQKADAEALIDAQATSQKEAIAEKQKQIAKDQADYEKAISLLKIGVKTAETVFQLQASVAQATSQGFVLASNPVTAAFAPIAFAAAAAIGAQIPFIIASGIAQAAAVALVPGFWKGTDNAPGGAAWVGERGTELLIDPQGRTALTPNGPTLTYLQPGTQVFTHEKTMNMLSRPEKLQASAGSFDFNQWSRIQAQHTSQIVKAVGQKSPTTVITKGGWRKTQGQNIARSQYENRYFK